LLLELFDNNGFSALYNFIYLPCDFETGRSLGYAFVNMVSTQDAMRAKEYFHGFLPSTSPSNKVCEVSWGEPVQGLEANIEKFRNSPVMHPEVQDAFKPMLFIQGFLSPFPGPTQRIRPPRMKFRKNQKVAQ
jgi:RNA recognition motif-containing protein